MMASKARSSQWLAAWVTVMFAVLCAAPLAAPAEAQSPGSIELSPGIPLPNEGASAIHIVPASPAQSVPATSTALLEQMSLAAGAIFAGKVMAVREPIGFAGSGQDAAEGIVEIDFLVGQSVRGPATGSIYTLREWSGLWAGHSGRYLVGQRLLLFLYAPNAQGLSAPVHGAEGAIPLRGGGIAPGPDDATAAAAEWMVDLRWLQAQVLRKRPLRLVPVVNQVAANRLELRSANAGSLRGAFPQNGGDRSELESDPSLVRAIREPWLRRAAAPVEAQPLSQVLALCHAAIVLEAMRARDVIR